jgi:hypothetical protein
MHIKLFTEVEHKHAYTLCTRFMCKGKVMCFIH